MSPAHAGPNTSGLYALGNISPVAFPSEIPTYNQRRQRENVLPTPPSGSAKTEKLVVEMPSSENPSLLYHVPTETRG